MSESQLVPEITEKEDATNDSSSTLHYEKILKDLRFIGQVKWFNTKAGYGFITVCGNDFLGKEVGTQLQSASQEDASMTENLTNSLNLFKGNDIFVHYSAITAENAQYKFLLQGEYVEFSIIGTDGGKYEYHAAKVSGIRGGTIMCETKKTYISNQPERQSVKSLTYVDNKGMRHYSKFGSKRPTDNLHSQATEKSSNTRETSQTKLVPPRPGGVMNDLLFCSENNISIPLFNTSHVNENDNQGEFKTVSRGRKRPKNIV